MRKTDTAVTAAELKARDAVIIAMAIAGKTPTETAAAIGVALSTVYRRLGLPDVKAALIEARAAEVRPLVTQAISHVQTSVERLVAVRDGATTRDGDRIKASVAILDWFRSVWEMSEVLPRIAAIESQLAAARAAASSNATDNPPAPYVGSVPDGLVGDDVAVVA